MMYKLRHRLFGWDYIAWKNTADQGIARVYVDGAGKAYYWRYESTHVADVIKEPDNYLWLTCSPTKYFPVTDENKEQSHEQ